MMKYCSAILLISCLLAACANDPGNLRPPDSAITMATDSFAYDPVEIKRAYASAIACYIDSVYKGTEELPDTLFIGKHDQFPEIQLPFTIQNVPVLLLSNDEYETKVKYRVHSVFINMIGTQKYKRWEFAMITFFNHAVPQHNCYVNFEYNPVVKEFTLDTLYLTYPYSVK